VRVAGAGLGAEREETAAAGCAVLKGGNEGLRVRKRGDEGKETSYVLLKFLGTSFPPENLSF
jgi:hypothetical protein